MPTKVRDFNYEFVSNGILLIWKEPVAKGSEDIRYYVWCGNENGTYAHILSHYYPTDSKTGNIECRVRIVFVIISSSVKSIFRAVSVVRNFRNNF